MQTQYDFDFTSILDRRGKDALAVDFPEQGKGGFAAARRRDGYDVIPMWVADMNFPTAPSIQRALAERIAHPAYGYFEESDAWYDAIIRWHETRNGVTVLTREAIGYENGVLGGVISALNVMAPRGSKILLHSPTYIGFTMCLENSGYEIVLSPLKKDADGIWRMDYADMEEKLRTQQIHAAVFCSPHNPAGRVWEQEELEQAMAIFEKYQVDVVSDEIWSDLVLEGFRHIPTQSVNDYARAHTVALYAPSKTFNLAGLIGSYHIIYDRRLHNLVRKQSSLSHYNSMNVLSMHALIGAYSVEGAAWVDALRQVLTGNVRYACEQIETHFPGIAVSRPQGPYMLFLDCTEYCNKKNLSLEEVLHRGWEVGVYWQDGRPFHGECAIRVNLALPLSRVQEAFRRLTEVL